MIENLFQIPSDSNPELPLGNQKELSPSLEPLIQITVSSESPNEENQPIEQLKEEQFEPNPIFLEEKYEKNKNEKMNLEEDEFFFGIDDSKDLTDLATLTNKKKCNKFSAKTYDDLVSIIRNKNSCEWQESRYSLPSNLIKKSLKLI